jgi:hypothetical protein
MTPKKWRSRKPRSESTVGLTRRQTSVKPEFNSDLTSSLTKLKSSAFCREFDPRKVLTLKVWVKSRFDVDFARNLTKIYRFDWLSPSRSLTYWRLNFQKGLSFSRGVFTRTYEHPSTSHVQQTLLFLENSVETYFFVSTRVFFLRFRSFVWIVRFWVLKRNQSMWKFGFNRWTFLFNCIQWSKEWIALPQFNCWQRLRWGLLECVGFW